MALEGTLKEFMEDLIDVSDALDGISLIKNAKASIMDELKNSEISAEERDRIYSNYVQQISVGLVTQAVDIVKTAPAAKYAEEEAKYKALQAEAGLRKQFGYSINDEGELVDEHDGTIDEQNDGFYKDHIYKTVKVFTEEAGMLAQNDIPTPPWMVDIMKIGSEILSRGHINLKWEKDDDGNYVLDEDGNKVTAVEYVGDGATVNGLEA